MIYDAKQEKIEVYHVIMAESLPCDHSELLALMYECIKQVDYLLRYQTQSQVENTLIFLEKISKKPLQEDKEILKKDVSEFFIKFLDDPQEISRKKKALFFLRNILISNDNCFKLSSDEGNKKLIAQVASVILRNHLISLFKNIKRVSLNDNGFWSDGNAKASSLHASGLKDRKRKSRSQVDEHSNAVVPDDVSSDLKKVRK